jgi:chromosome segregation ATPase
MSSSAASDAAIARCHSQIYDSACNLPRYTKEQEIECMVIHNQIDILQTNLDQLVRKIQRTEDELRRLNEDAFINHAAHVAHYTQQLQEQRSKQAQNLREKQQWEQKFQQDFPALYAHSLVRKEAYQQIRNIMNGH